MKVWNEQIFSFFRNKSNIPLTSYMYIGYDIYTIGKFFVLMDVHMSCKKNITYLLLKIFNPSFI